MANPLLLPAAAAPTATAAAVGTPAGFKTALAADILTQLGVRGLDSLFGNKPAPATGTSSKFTITANDLLAFEQWAAGENYRRSLLGKPPIDVQAKLKEAIALNNKYLEESSRRDAYLERVRGEMAALNTGIQALGNLGSEKERTLQTAINKVLARDPVGSNQALANLSRGY